MDSSLQTHDLIAKFTEGLASAEESSELARLIIDDVSVADAFAKATRFDATLNEFFCNDRTAREARQSFEDANESVVRAISDMDTSALVSVGEPLRDRSAARWRRAGIAGMTIGACAVAASICVVVWSGHDPKRNLPIAQAAPVVDSARGGVPDGGAPVDAGHAGAPVAGTASTEVPVARITQMIGVKFANKEFAPVVGDPFRTGVYRLTNGIMELTFAHSGEVILEAPCEFDLKGRELMVLHRGKISAKVPKSAGDFTVETPTATVVDKGTEFGVHVDDDEDSEVHVFDGMVAVTPRSGDPLYPVILRGQTASAIGKKSATPRGIDVDADRFLRRLSEPDSMYARVARQWNPVFYYRMIPAGEVIHDYGPLVIDAAVVRGGSEGTPWTVGRIGSALKFGGPSAKDYAIVPDYPKATDGTLSVAAWVFAKSRPRSATIAKNWSDDVHGQFRFGLFQDSGQLEIVITDGQGQEVGVRDKTPLPIGKWEHVAFVADGTMLRLYRNGVEVGAVGHAGLGGDPKLKVMGIGVQLKHDGSQPDFGPFSDDDAGYSDFWHGRIDELALFNHALRPEEIWQLYESTDSPE